MKRRVISNIASNIFGKFASHRFHPVLQKFINKSYVKMMHLDMREFKNASEYASLNELFTRSLEVDREIEDGIVSPTDSLVTEAGKVSEGKAMQIKGMSYSVDELLLECDAKSVYEGEYVNLYLSPRDYHRYHMPLDLQIKKVVHIPGKLYPVNFFYLKRKRNLFLENERVIVECATKEGKRVFIVLVGALNVGKMTLTFEKRIETNKKNELAIYTYDDLWMKKGELLGYFKMGSTVLLFFEKNYCKLLVKPMQKVKFGQKIGEINEK